MPRDGSGSYTLPAGNPVVTLTTISTSWANTTLSDLATEMTNSIDKAGRTVPTANLPMGGFRHTGAAAAVAAGQYLVHSQSAMGPLSASTIVASGMITAEAGLQRTAAGSLDISSVNAAGTIDLRTAGVSALAINASQNSTFGGNTIASRSTNGVTSVAAANANAGGSAAAQVYATTAAGTMIMSQYGAGHATRPGQGWVFNEAFQPLILGTDNTERMRIAASGNIAFGTPNTSSSRVTIQSDGLQLRIRNNTTRYRSDLIVTDSGLALYNSYDDTGGVYMPIRVECNELSFFTGGPFTSERVRIDSVGRLSGFSLHNNSNLPSGTSPQYIASGTYTPSGTIVSNLTSLTPNAAQWMRVGNVVTVSGSVVVLVTAHPATTTFRLTLPLASNLTDLTQVAGTLAFITSNQSGRVLADTVNDQARFDWQAADSLVSETISYTYTYLLL